MLAKEYRLTEKETKKVLHKWKPFFSHEIVLNIIKNNYNHNRFSIVIWWKSVKTNVERSFFRRRFYDYMLDRIDKAPFYDMVFTIKRTTKLDKEDKNSLENYKKTLNYLINKIWKDF